MVKLFPILISLEFFIAAGIFLISKNWAKALFYFFSGAINVSVIFLQ